jgi:biotin carboxyl carrier protein
MKKYNVTVNGNTYEVEVEEIDRSNETITQSNAVNQTSQAIPESGSEPKKENKLKSEASKKSSTSLVESETINAPMPGSILDVKVSVGDTVIEGETLLILEAMKMENEIMSPRDGKIIEVSASKGQSVETGDSLIAIE